MMLPFIIAMSACTVVGILGASFHIEHDASAEPSVLIENMRNLSIIGAGFIGLLVAIYSLLMKEQDLALQREAHEEAKKTGVEQPLELQER